MNANTVFYAVFEESGHVTFKCYMDGEHRTIIKLTEDTQTYFDRNGLEMITLMEEEMSDADIERMLDAAWKEVGFGAVAGRALDALLSHNITQEN